MQHKLPNLKQKEYERRRGVWRYLHNLPGPHEPPKKGDEAWLKSEWREI